VSEHVHSEAATGEAPVAGAAPVPAAAIALQPSALQTLLRSGDGASRARMISRLQRAHGNAAVAAIARKVTYDDCAAGQQAQIGDAHVRGKELAKIAIKKLRDYDGSTPAEVKTALKKHFNSESKWVARIVANNLAKVVPQVDDTQYECHEKQEGSAEAEALWCIPFSDIKVFPLWYGSSRGTKILDERASTLIHEWMHRYACKLDVGYEWEEGYANASTIRQLANSDPYGMLCFDVRLP
jgi:hypothetical protein